MGLDGGVGQDMLFSLLIHVMDTEGSRKVMSATDILCSQRIRDRRLLGTKSFRAVILLLFLFFTCTATAAAF